MKKRPLVLSKLALILALVCAMVATGFAHKSPNSYTNLTPELARYVAAGGALGDICGPADEQDGAQNQSCETCRLTGAALIPPFAPCARPVTTDRAQRFAFVAKRLHETRALDPARLTRAPPHA